MFFDAIYTDTLVFILFIIFASAVFIQLLFYWGVFSRLAFYKKKSLEQQYKPVSVVICARNEYTNLKKNLPLFLEQDYPDYEVLVVNDCSDDETEYLLRDFSDIYPHLKIATIKENVNFFGGKKFALAVGIKSAANEQLLLTDADCWPKSNRWIMEMQNNFRNKTEIVLGYSGYKQYKGFLNKLIRFDTVMIAMQYLSFSLIGKTYMGVGRNLAYKKSLFINVKGFTSHYHIKSGDDDIFINQVATRNNSRIEIATAAQTVSEPKKTYTDWVRQKKRHLTTGRYYKFIHKFLLFLYSISNMLFYITFFALLTLLILKLSLYTILLVCALFILKITSQLIIFKKTMVKLQEKNLLLISPLLDLFFIFLNPFFALSNYIIRDTKWK
jgi:poly-beta-1,6-N-acetyl-D-glucosamine synthase